MPFCHRQYMAVVILVTKNFLVSRGDQHVVVVLDKIRRGIGVKLYKSFAALIESVHRK